MLQVQPAIVHKGTVNNLPAEGQAMQLERMQEQEGILVNEAVHDQELVGVLVIGPEGDQETQDNWHTDRRMLALWPAVAIQAVEVFHSAHTARQDLVEEVRTNAHIAGLVEDQHYWNLEVEVEGEMHQTCWNAEFQLVGY